MWIEKTPNGFRAVERYIDPFTGKAKKVSVSIEKNTASTRKLAEKILQEKIERKQEKQSQKITFAELIDAWLCYQKHNVKESSYVCYSFSTRGIIKAIGRDTLVDSLTARYVNEQLNRYYDSPTSQNGFIKRFKAIIIWGFDNDYVQDISWLNKLKTRKDIKKKISLADKYLERNELDSLLSSMEILKWKELTMFLALTGMRIGEALALEYTDVDLQSRQILITKTLSETTHKIQSAKTESSIREVYIQDQLYPLCVTLKNKASDNRFISPLLFFKCNKVSYYKYITRTSEKILGKQISPHALRHTHVALLAENGIPLDVISRRLGHSSTAITRDIYFHVTSRLKEKDNMAVKEIKIM